MRKILITGGAGFIGSALIRHILNNSNYEVINVDKLTYAGNLESIKMEVVKFPTRYNFEHIDICDQKLMTDVFFKHNPDIVMHLAAESHVDRSIDNPSAFIQTNIVGTYTLLEVARNYWNRLTVDKKLQFRFHHISTDEVYGSLGEKGLFTEQTPYNPNSPYSASKASSDHLVRAWQETYGLPTITTNCSNNYGPYHFPEKLIPLMILNGLQGKPLPIYGKGDNVRDWLYVEDHAKALLLVATQGIPGSTYNIGGNNERTNLQVVESICSLLDELVPNSKIKSHRSLINFVKDRPGHDKRYAIDASKIKKELDFEPQESFESGLRKTVQWYINNPQWVQSILDGSYKLERLGLKI